MAAPIVYAVFMTVMGMLNTGPLIVSVDPGRTVEMPLDECVSKAEEYNSAKSGNTDVMVCMPVPAPTPPPPPTSEGLSKNA